MPQRSPSSPDGLPFKHLACASDIAYLLELSDAWVKFPLTLSIWNSSVSERLGVFVFGLVHVLAFVCVSHVKLQ